MIPLAKTGTIDWEEVIPKNPKATLYCGRKNAVNSGRELWIEPRKPNGNGGFIVARGTVLSSWEPLIVDGGTLQA